MLKYAASRTTYYKDKTMETKDPVSSKSPTADTDANNANTVHEQNKAGNVDNVDRTAEQKGTQTLQETVIGTQYASDDVEHGDHTHEDIHHNEHNVMSTDHKIEEKTTVNKGMDNKGMDNKGTDTFQDSLVGSVHVNAGDNEARLPDRRDQKGNPFDEGINEHSRTSDAPKSEGITDMNRYANIDNAQTRILNSGEKD